MDPASMNPLPLREISLFGAIVNNDPDLLKEQMYHTDQVNIDATPSSATCHYFRTNNLNIDKQTPLQVAITMNRPSLIKTLTTLSGHEIHGPTQVHHSINIVGTIFKKHHQHRCIVFENQSVHRPSRYGWMDRPNACYLLQFRRHTSID